MRLHRREIYRKQSRKQADIRSIEGGNYERI